MIILVLFIFSISSCDNGAKKVEKTDTEETKEEIKEEKKEEEDDW